MATTTLTSNLKLRISSDLTKDSKYNLQRIDNLASIYQIDTNQVAKVRSQTDISFQPNDTDIGGSGSGGTVTIGSPNQPVANFQVNADVISLSSQLALGDQAAGGTKNLKIGYKSDISGAVDTIADRTLQFDLEGADRNLVVSSDGVLVLEDATQTLTSKTIDTASNTILDINNSNIASAAAIDGSKIAPDFAAQIVQSTGGFSSTPSVGFKFPTSDGPANQVLTTDGSGQLFFSAATSSNLVNLTDTTIISPIDNQILVYSAGSWINSTPASGSGGVSEIWTNADGLTKTITHNLGTRNIIIQVLDNNNDYKTIDVDAVCRPTDNTAVLESTIAPPSDWTVILTEI